MPSSTTQNAWQWRKNGLWSPYNASGLVTNLSHVSNLSTSGGAGSMALPLPACSILIYKM
jgi:hypothetical protein